MMGVVHKPGVMIAIAPLSRFANEPMADDDGGDEDNLGREQQHDPTARPHDFLTEVHEGLRKRDQQAAHLAMGLARALQEMVHAAQRNNADRLQYWYTLACEIVDDEDRTGKSNEHE